MTRPGDPLKYSLIPAVVVALCTGCLGNFDEELYMAGLSGELADVCGLSAPLLRFPPGERSFEFDVDTRGATDTTREVVECTGNAQGGPEVFISINAETGQHWHFHVDVDPFENRSTANPAVYVLGDDCDERACSVGDGLDLCAAGADEHFTFIPETTDRYIVAFDSPDSGFQGRVLAFRTVCGDGERDHSENCDDGNTVSGDGCSERCLTELSGAAPTEVEVNDDIFSANLVDVSGGAVTVRATLNKLCEVDVFAIEVPEGGSIRATLAGDGGTSCPADLIDTRLELIERTGRGPSLIATGAVVSGDTCPSIGAAQARANNLPAGTYYVAASVLRDRPDTLQYELTLSTE